MLRPDATHEVAVDDVDHEEHRSQAAKRWMQRRHKGHHFAAQVLEALQTVARVMQSQDKSRMMVSIHSAEVERADDEQSE